MYVHLMYTDVISGRLFSIFLFLLDVYILPHMIKEVAKEKFCSIIRVEATF